MNYPNNKGIVLEIPQSPQLLSLKFGDEVGHLEHGYNLADASLAFAYKNLQQRIGWAYGQYGDGLVLTSAFGVESALMLQAVTDLDLDIPVLSVDIQTPKYDAQRAYRDQVHDALGFDLYLARAKGDDDKVSAMEYGLKALGAKAVLSGIRASHNANRAGKAFIERGRVGTVSVNPILDWSNAQSDYTLQALPAALRHPDYVPGVRSKGGVVLAPEEEKTECGCHTLGLDGAGI